MTVLAMAMLAVFSGAPRESPAAPDGFVLETSDSQVLRAHAMARRVVAGNIKPWKHGLLEEEEPAIMAGASYGRPWTRDASYNTYFAVGLLYPAVARNTLLSVLERAEGGAVRIGGQYWDAISWVTGAWAYYAYTADRAFLRTAFDATRNTLAHREGTEFDAATGLFCGPGWSDGVAGYPAPYHEAGGSSFILDYARHNAHIDKIRMKALSTNCLHANAYRLAARMGQELGDDPARVAGFVKRADALAAAINGRLWLEDAGHYAYFIDRAGKRDPSLEGLGHAQAILFGVADADRAARIFETQYVSRHGIPCVWPLFPRFREGGVGRHCGTVWPQIQGFWALAAASRGRLAILDHELRALTDTALRSDDFREIYHPETGEPYGGMQVGRLWKSEPRQTWAATAYLAMLYRGVFGMDFHPKGVRFRPLVPRRLAPLALRDVRYRDMHLTIAIRGSGDRIALFALDGAPRDRHEIPATLRGRHTIEILLRAADEREPK